MELKGRLSNFALPDIVQLIGTNQHTGVLVVSIGSSRASVYFEEGNIVHAEYRNMSGQEVLDQLCQEKEGEFQFLSNVEAPQKTVMIVWMHALMEAARRNDESQRDSGSQEGAAAREWDPDRIKDRMIDFLRESFGKKARKIEKELKKCPGDKLAMMDFCDKAEKFVYVFIDSGQSEGIAEKLRHIIEEGF